MAGGYRLGSLYSGGAKSVRLKLEGEGETSYSDEMLLNEIEGQQRV
ncbi:hypothetical protein [Microcoleus vaginatus]